MYALPQSPQLFKQLLMVSGLDRYFQIVRCFRDENPRADRQWEFTQLDVEMSFPTEEDVIEVVEAMFVRLMRDVLGEEVNVPFPRLPYREAMARYGSDKPDTRYGMELADVSSVFRESSFQAFSSVVASGGVVKGFAAPGAASWSRRELDGLVQEARSRGAAGLVWLAFEGLQVRSPVEKHLSFAEVESVRKATGAEVGDLVLLVAGQPGRTHVVLDGLRRVIASRLELVPDGVWNFLWITEMPLFEWGEEEGKWVSMHHPFTSPSSEDLEPETATARAYDLTLNGWELGGGSIRIHRPDVQERVFAVLGLSHQDVVEKFGFLLEAFRYGVPPHGGIAFGIDRIAMLLAGKDTIRDVIAFPKTQSGIEPMTGAPAPPSEEQLEVLGIRFVEADRPV
jgi:aspartyl-tRNA synthetase